MNKITKLIAVASLAVLAAGAAEARSLRIAPGAPPVHPAADPLYKTFAIFLPEETNGELDGTLIGPEVVSVTQTKEALQSSLAEVANLLPLFVPGDLPNTVLTADLAFLATTPHAMGAAMTEYVVTCEECQAEFKQMGGVFVGAGSSDVYVLITTKPVNTLADLQGLRLRSGGAPYARWAEAVGAAPAQIPVNDTFESMSQGVIDGTMASVGDLISYRLVDIAKYIIEVPLGTYHTTSNFTVANTTWAELSPEQREGLARAANRSSALFTENWGYERAVQARQIAVDNGMEILIPGQDVLDATNAFRTADLEAAVSIAESQLGVTGAAEKIERFRDLVEKWTGIIEETGNDTDAIAARVQQEVWDKVDWTTYGL
ncbi:C4-dicarboxylate TRAP transporter substrate-binding protein [Pelagibacterium sediminicola]|uniref:C4-dicarboxylate TRAP transporter substrate-binding protein n=1 Tax=Pelagibacterium sediminicola TaxID=2248761 RepID=UPI000E3109C6|nr:C4-dicarboxylate TRAP transporter substrate-binding protein [Pelagibacterium sediminicola]